MSVAPHQIHLLVNVEVVNLYIPLAKPVYTRITPWALGENLAPATCDIYIKSLSNVSTKLIIGVYIQS